MLHHCVVLAVAFMAHAALQAVPTQEHLARARWRTGCRDPNARSVRQWVGRWLKEVMGLVVKKGWHGKKSENLIEDFCQQQNIKNVAKFTAMTLADLSTLHAGASVGLGITEAQLINGWRKSLEPLCI